MDYFNVSREELFKNEETETIIVKKNVSISKMKKLIISLSSALVVLIATTIILFTSLMPKLLSKQLDKLGDFNAVKISLKEASIGEIYYLDPFEENIQDKALAMLDTIEYKLYSKNKLVEPAWLGAYTVILEGDVTIYINATYLIVDRKYRTIKEYTNDTLFNVIDLLISSESIEVTDENFNQ